MPKNELLTGKLGDVQVTRATAECRFCVLESVFAIYLPSGWCTHLCLVTTATAEISFLLSLSSLYQKISKKSHNPANTLLVIYTHSLTNNR